MSAHILRLHDVLYKSKVNGPGVRTVIWTQGCDKRCDGCWNPDTWDPIYGRTVTVEEIVKKIPLHVINGITFSGGEPFLQSLACAELSRALKRMGKTVMCYTGYEYEELKKSGDSRVDEFLNCIDILVDGPYLKGFPPEHPWAGSGNQKVYALKNGDIENVIQHEGAKMAIEHEYIISKDGTITATGL